MLDVIDIFLGRALKENSCADEPLFMNPYEKNVLVIVCGAKPGAAESLASVRKLAEAGYYITLFSSKNGREVWGERLAELTGANRYLSPYSDINPEFLVNNNSALVIAGLSVGAVSKIASACFDSLPLYIIYQFMLAGKKIVASDYGVFKSFSGERNPFTNETLVKVIDINMSITADMGVKYVEPFNIHKEFDLSGIGDEGGQNTPTANTYDKNVLSISDLAGYPDNSSLYLRKGTIATPSAKDHAKTKNISIVYITYGKEGVS